MCSGSRDCSHLDALHGPLKSPTLNLLFRPEPPAGRGQGSRPCAPGEGPEPTGTVSFPGPSKWCPADWAGTSCPGQLLSYPLGPTENQRERERKAYLLSSYCVPTACITPLDLPTIIFHLGLFSLCLECSSSHLAFNILFISFGSASALSPP